MTPEELQVLAALLMGEQWTVDALHTGFISAHGRGKYRRKCKLTVMLTEGGCTAFVHKGKSCSSVRLPAADNTLQVLMDMALT